jgi:hypothetical protein
MKKLLAGLLGLSLVLNLVLWSRLASQSSQLKSAQASASESEELRRQNQELESRRNSAAESARADARELARLRNQVAQLRKQAGDAATSGAQTAEATQLRARLAAATQHLARMESELAEAVKLSPEELQQLKGEAQSVECVNNMKQIGLAARKWANDHNDVFPTDFVSMKDELGTPKILFCPADAGAVRVTEWSQLNPSSISYRLLNANGSESDPNKVLTTCPMHGHTGLSDGSVHREMKPAGGGNTTP